jgi:hypothetical protein
MDAIATTKQLLRKNKMKKLQKGTSNKLSIVPAAVSDRIDNPR